MALEDIRIGRREFLGAGLGMLGAASKPVEFGVISDVHHNFVPDARKRLDAFLEAASHRNPDFLIQCGDFCHGYPAKLNDDQRAFLKAWQSGPTRKYNVFGNHETDRNVKAAVVDFLQMPKPYYSFDCRGVHFVVVDCLHIHKDGKYLDYEKGNYFKYAQSEINWVDPEQLEWLAEDLRRTQFPTILFAHPSVNDFWKPGASDSRRNLRDTLERANQQAGWQKVVAFLSGHEHVDHYSQRAGIHYLLVNSSSYLWMGQQYGRLSTYRDPLYAFVKVDPAGSITIEGRRSVFIPPTPKDVHFPDARNTNAFIKNRRLRFKPPKSV